MENNFNPTKEDFAPISNETLSAPACPAAETESLQVTKYKAAKKAFAKAGLAFLLVFLVMQSIGGIFQYIGLGIDLISQINSGELDIESIQSSGDINEIYNTLFTAFMSSLSGRVVLLWSTIGTAVSLSVAMLVERKVMKKIPAAPIEKKKLSIKEYLFMLLVVSGMWAIGALAGNIPGFFGLISPLDDMFSAEGVAGWVMVVYAVIGAPILEELVCRKVLLDKLHAYGEVPAAFLSALLFGLFHGNSAQFVLAFTMGLAAALVYMRTGNILYTMSFHAIINAVGSVTNVAELLEASEKTLEILNIGQIALMGVLAVVGLALAIAKRREPIMKLERPDYAGANTVIFKNGGYIVFLIISILLVVGIDLMTFAMNVIEIGLLSLIAFVPTVLFFIIVFGVMKTVGKKNTSGI